jgi:xanthine/CO dehydrogenase XdhC/CoxF family maturation factor
VYYRFSLVLQVEQDMIGTLAGGGSEEEFAAVMKQLEESPESPQELEEQVHWERAGVVCTACRALVVRTLTPKPAAVGPH